MTEPRSAWTRLKAVEPMRVDVETARLTCKRLLHELVDLVEHRDALRAELLEVDAQIGDLLKGVD